MTGKVTAIVSGVSALATWQEQLEWGIRVGAGAIAIVAGLVSIVYTIRKHHK